MNLFGALEGKKLVPQPTTNWKLMNRGNIFLDNLKVSLAQLVKNLPAVQEIQLHSLGQEESPGEGNGKPLQYYCLKTPGQRRLAVINNVCFQLYIS